MERQNLERRNFLKLAMGVAAGAAAFTAAAGAAPLSPQPIEGASHVPPAAADMHPAVTSSEEVAELRPEQVHWHGHHWGWGHRHWGWRHRHWGWRHRYW